MSGHWRLVGALGGALGCLLAASSTGAAEFLAQIHEELGSASLAGTIDLLGAPLEFAPQQPGSLEAGLDGAIPVLEPLSAGSFRLGGQPSLVLVAFPEPLSPSAGGQPGQAGGVFGGRLALDAPRDLPPLPLPGDVGTFPASRLESAAFDVALRELAFQLSSPSPILVSGGAFDAQKTVGSLSGFADVDGQLTLSFERVGEYLTAATMLGIVRGIYPEIITDVEGNLLSRELTVTVQTRMELAEEALDNSAPDPGDYRLVGMGPALGVPWLTQFDETLLDGVASVSLRISGLAVAPAPGDASGDGVIDLSDFGVVKSNFGRAANLAGGDLDGSGQVTLDDFGILKAQFGKTAAPAAVPEPSGAVLLAAAGLLFGAASAFRRPDLPKNSLTARL